MFSTALLFLNGRKPSWRLGCRRFHFLPRTTCFFPEVGSAGFLFTPKQGYMCGVHIHNPSIQRRGGNWVFRFKASLGYVVGALSKLQKEMVRKKMLLPLVWNPLASNPIFPLLLEPSFLAPVLKVCHWAPLLRYCSFFRFNLFYIVITFCLFILCGVGRTQAEVWGIGSLLLPCESQESNSRCQFSWQVSLTAQPCGRPSHSSEMKFWL